MHRKFSPDLLPLADKAKEARVHFYTFVIGGKIFYD